MYWEHAGFIELLSCLQQTYEFCNENCNQHIEDDENTRKETLDELYGLYGCLEDEFCYLTLYDKAAPTVNKRR